MPVKDKAQESNRRSRHKSDEAGREAVKNLNGEATVEKVTATPEEIIAAGKMAKLKPSQSDQLIIPNLDLREEMIYVQGMAPLIVNAFSEKAQQMIQDKQGGKASAGRDPKVPWECFCDALHWITPKPAKPTEDDVRNATFGFPAIAFKSAAVTACTSLKKAFPKTMARQAFHVLGDMLPILSGPPSMRQDTVRLAASGSADLRYRPEFKEWKVQLRVRYNARVISLEQLMALLDVAGFGVGVGEWRPEKDGQYGLFEVVKTRVYSEK